MTDNTATGPFKTKTLFKYRCVCGFDDFLEVNGSIARCRCGVSYPISRSGVISFTGQTSEQNEYFDTLYQDGHAHRVFDFLDSATPNGCAPDLADAYLGVCGFDHARPADGLSVLDLACGSGWLTAELLRSRSVRNCRLHAFDISSSGPELLAIWHKDISSSSSLEMSVQDAEAMVFADATFDVVIGSSVLHHFDAYEKFLADCWRILRPGGVATFGEPFGMGYGLGTGILMIAQEQLGKDYPAIEAMYNDIRYRNTSKRELLVNLVDKHLFFQAAFLKTARGIGFDDVSFIPLQSAAYYRDHFIEELLKERSIDDEALAKVASKMYRTVFDLFDNGDLGSSIAPFIQVVLKR